MQLFFKIGNILLQYCLFRICVADSDEDWNHISRWNFQFFFHDIMFFIQRNTHGTAKVFCCCRQEDILNMVIDICHTEFKFDNFNEVMDYFKKMINICKQMNYSPYKSEQYEQFHQQLQQLIDERKA